MQRNIKGKNWADIIDLLFDSSDEVTEIETNGTTSLFTRENGKRVEYKDTFSGVKDYEEKINGLIAMFEDDYDKEHYGAHRYLAEGVIHLKTGEKARVHIVMPPASETPQVTIARRVRALSYLDALQDKKSFDGRINAFLKAVVKANMTICLSGGTGAGKALHKTTKIPTPYGMSTVEELNVGDVIFDERGYRTTILDKYCPHDKTSYEVTFNNGQEIVRCSGGHLWEVNSRSGKLEVLSTAEMAERQFIDELERERQLYDDGFLDNDYSFVINKLTLPTQNSHSEPKVPFGKVATLIAAYDSTERKISREYNLEDDFVDMLLRGLPNEYLHGSVEQRIEFIRHLVAVSKSLGRADDFDGEIQLELPNKRVRDDVKAIISSLGVRHEELNNTEIMFDSDIIYYGVVDSDPMEFVITNIDKLENEDPADYFCFKVDSPNHLFLCTESMIPTHNTTALEAIAREWDDSVRIGVVEDSPELDLTQPNVTYLKSSTVIPGRDPNDSASLQWCVKQINRQRTDKLIIGETRGGEFAQFLTGANSGMEGSVTTIHANSPEECLQKMTQFTLEGSTGLNIFLANKVISQCLNFIIQLGENKYKQKRLLKIVEVSNSLSNDPSATIAVSTIFEYDELTDTWSFHRGNLSDKIVEKFKLAKIDPDNFGPVGRYQTSSYNHNNSSSITRRPRGFNPFNKGEN